jgi:hypothetical protein
MASNPAPDPLRALLDDIELAESGARLIGGPFPEGGPVGEQGFLFIEHTNMSPEAWRNKYGRRPDPIEIKSAAPAPAEPPPPGATFESGTPGVRLRVPSSTPEHERELESGKFTTRRP